VVPHDRQGPGRPCGVGLRGFESHPPHSSLNPVTYSQAIGVFVRNHGRLASKAGMQTLDDIGKRTGELMAHRKRDVRQFAFPSSSTLPQPRLSHLTVPMRARMPITRHATMNKIRIRPIQLNKDPMRPSKVPRKKALQVSVAGGLQKTASPNINDTTTPMPSIRITSCSSLAFISPS